MDSSGTSDKQQNKTKKRGGGTSSNTSTKPRSAYDDLMKNKRIVGTATPRGVFKDVNAQSKIAARTPPSSPHTKTPVQKKYDRVKRKALKILIAIGAALVVFYIYRIGAAYHVKRGLISRETASSILNQPIAPKNWGKLGQGLGSILPIRKINISQIAKSSTHLSSNAGKVVVSNQFLEILEKESETIKIALTHLLATAPVSIQGPARIIFAAVLQFNNVVVYLYRNAKAMPVSPVDFAGTSETAAFLYNAVLVSSTPQGILKNILGFLWYLVGIRLRAPT